MVHSRQQDQVQQWLEEFQWRKSAADHGRNPEAGKVAKDSKANLSHLETETNQKLPEMKYQHGTR
jgi:hypothetical protein